MEEIKKFIEKLREDRNTMNAKLGFFLDHKFDHEANYLRTKINVINTILYELEGVAEGNITGEDISFDFTSN